jgi:hypothetical protein
VVWSADNAINAISAGTASSSMGSALSIIEPDFRPALATDEDERSPVTKRTEAGDEGE